MEKRVQSIRRHPPPDRNMGLLSFISTILPVLIVKRAAVCLPLVSQFHSWTLPVRHSVQSWWDGPSKCLSFDIPKSGHIGQVRVSCQAKARLMAQFSSLKKTSFFLSHRIIQAGLLFGAHSETAQGYFPLVYLPPTRALTCLFEKMSCMCLRSS